MTDLDLTRALLTDSFGRIRELVTSVTQGLDEDLLGRQLSPSANPIGWLVWHLTRVQDDHIAEAAGVDQAWSTWRARFALPFDDLATGYGQRADEVSRVRVPAELLVNYHGDVHALTQRYLDGLSADELQRVIDERWDPPVTVSVRLVSVVGDCMQHLGQAAYVRGCWRGS